MIRAARPTDQAYVASTWVNSVLSMEYAVSAPKNVPKRESRRVRMLVDSFLDRDDVKLLISCKPGDENAIVGWLCFTRMVSASLVQAPRYVVHFGYVRDEWRRKGVLRQLLEAAGIAGPLVYTFDGPTTKQLGKTLLANAVHVHPSQFLGVA